MPSGSTMFLPTVSASNKSQLPRRMATGKNNCARGPTSALAIWGAISPINAIPPDTDTAEAASATAMISIITRSRSKGNPSPMAGRFVQL